MIRLVSKIAEDEALNQRLFDLLLAKDLKVLALYQLNTNTLALDGVKGIAFVLSCESTRIALEEPLTLMHKK